MKFTGVLAEQVPKVWKDALPHIKRASDYYNTHQMDKLYQSIIDRKRQLWIAGEKGIDAILITQIKKDTCYIELCGGKGMDALQFLKIVEKWAKENGCIDMEINGRKGWQKLLPDYKIEKITLKKVL